MTNKYTTFIFLFMVLLIASCGSQPNDEVLGEKSKTQTPSPQEQVSQEEDSTSQVEEPCILIPNSDLPTYYRPDLESELFETMPSGMPVYVFAESVNGWIGFDPGIPQAANVGPFRLRWVQKTGEFSLQGDCDALPVIEPPPAGVCFTMAMTEFPVYETPSIDADVLMMLESDDFVAVTSQPTQNWYEVDLSTGSLDVEVIGWIESQWINLNGPCTSILHQLPSGSNMDPIPRGEEITITHIQMITPTTGWAIGHIDENEDHILVTMDGGKFWSDVSPPDSGISIEEPRKKAVGAFLKEDSARIAYRIYDGIAAEYKLRFWNTEDVGDSWAYGGESQTLEMDELDQAMKFVDPNHGWFLHEIFVGVGHHRDQFLRTQNGGTSYQNLHEEMNTESTCHSTDYAFSDAMNGWKTLHCPFEPGEVFLATTMDGGFEWDRISLPPPSDRPDVFRSASSCWTYAPHMHSADSGAVMVSCDIESGPMEPNHFVYLTNDGGATWETHRSPEGQLTLIDPSRGWLFGRDIYWSDDGGRGWSKIKTVSWDGQFSFVSESLGWAIARSDDEIALVRTFDGGETWTLMEPRVSGTSIGETSGTDIPCELSAISYVTAFRRPSYSAEEFAEIPRGTPLLVQARTANDWVGFDPEYAQAANIGVFRLRWVSLDSAIELSGDCADVPIVEGPAPGICFTMPMSETPIYALPDTSADVLVVLNAGDYVEVEGRYGADWMRVDLSEGNIGIPTKGWMEASSVNFNCPDTNLGEVTP